MSAFAVKSFGERLTQARQGRELARALQAAVPDEQETLVVDLTGVVQARPLPFHHLLKAARLKLGPHYPRALVRIVNVRQGVRWALEQALSERHDFVVSHAEGDVYELSLTCPTMVDHDGETIAVGSRRRQMIAVIARDGNGCVWCGRELSYDHPQATLDHVRPHSKDGSKRLGNMLLSCADCNYARKDRSAGEWMKDCLARGQEVNVLAVRAAIKRSRRNRSLRRSFLSSRQRRQVPGSADASLSAGTS